MNNLDDGARGTSCPTGPKGAEGLPGKEGPCFAVFSGKDVEELSAKLNAWATCLPPKARIRRTQLCSHSGNIVALVNWDAPGMKES